MKFALYTYEFDPELHSDPDLSDLIPHVYAWKLFASGLRAFGEAHAQGRDLIRTGLLVGIEPYTGSGRLLRKVIHFTPQVVLLRLPGEWPPSPQESAIAEKNALEQVPF